MFITDVLIYGITKKDFQRKFSNEFYDIQLLLEKMTLENIEQASYTKRDLDPNRATIEKMDTLWRIY